MKVTVCINEIKIVVPCGDGDLSIRQLAELAIIRYRKTPSKGVFPDFIGIDSLKLARDGGILDWDDKVNDVLDDRDLLIAQHGANVPGKLTSPPLPHRNQVASGDIITTTSVSDAVTPVAPAGLKSPTSPPVSTKYVPLSFGISSLTSDLYTSRHNSIPCSDHDLHRHFDFFDKETTTRYESLDNIFDLNNPNRKLVFQPVNVEYEKWPLPPFPTISTLQSSTETTVLPNNMTLKLHEADADETTWDNSPNDCDEEDYPRLRPDYIIKHFENNQTKLIDNSVPSHQVLQWLESQECGSVSSSGNGGVGTSSYEAGSDMKEPDFNNVTIVLDDRNNNRGNPLSSSMSSATEQNRIREDTLQMNQTTSQQLENSIIVRLTNIKPGENLGIEIVPVYIQSNTLHQTYDPKCIYGIEVHSIVPKGRVAKERQLNKGDKILQINDISLMGMSYERGETIFRDALQKTECKLRVIPFQYSFPTSEQLNLNKPNPPPPPRRSPNTALTTKTFTTYSYDKDIPIPMPNNKSPMYNVSINTKTTSSKLNPVPIPPSQQNPVASWTSGFGSMVHTPASSTSSVENKKVEKIHETVMPPKTELIELTKIGSGFGFSITGIDNLPPNIPGAVYVKHILSDGAAIRDGRLKSDDRILEIDGLLLDGMTQTEVIALLREKPSGSRVKLLVQRNATMKNSPFSASHDSLMTSLSEMDENGSTLSKNMRNSVKLQFDIPLNDSRCPGGRTTLGISVKVEPNWDKANITPFSSKQDIAASNIVWVKTVIENGAAYLHGKLMVGDQLLQVNGVTLSGLSSDEALTKLKNIIKTAQDSEDGIINVVVLRKINLARSSSLNTLNSVTGSGSAISFKPIFDHNRKFSNNVPIDDNGKMIDQIFDQREKIEPNNAQNVTEPGTFSHFSSMKVSSKPSKRSAPLPPTPEPSHSDNSSTDKSDKSKPAPPPPPLARRIKNVESGYDTCQFVPKSTQSSSSDVVANLDHHYASYAIKKNIHKESIDSNYKSDEFPLKSYTEPQCSSTTNTLCRNKENSQLILRARNTRSNCSYTPTKEILHIDDIDWDKMELIPFDNFKLSSELVKPLHNASISQPIISQSVESKRLHDTGVQKRKPFKKFGQIFKFKHSHYSKPSNSAGSSPINMRKQKDSDRKDSINKDNAIPISSSSYSLKSSDQVNETEFPYAELDFSHSPTVPVTAVSAATVLSTINPLKTSNHIKNALLPLPEESFKAFQSPSSEESDSYEDFVDMQTAFPGHISAVQRITAATPKQPPNRFVYEDAEELFQSLQANVSLYHDLNLTPATFSPPKPKDAHHDVYQNIICGLSTTQTGRPPSADKSRPFVTKSSAEPDLSVANNSGVRSLISPNGMERYLNWPLLPK